MPKFSGCLMAALLASALAMPANAGAEPPKKDAGTARAAPVVHAAPHVAAPHFAPRGGGSVPHFTAHPGGTPHFTARSGGTPHFTRHFRSTACDPDRDREPQPAHHAARSRNRLDHPWFVHRAVARPHPP